MPHKFCRFTQESITFDSFIQYKKILYKKKDLIELFPKKIFFGGSLWVELENHQIKTRKIVFQNIGVIEKNFFMTLYIPKDAHLKVLSIDAWLIKLKCEFF